MPRQGLKPDDDNVWPKTLFVTRVWSNEKDRAVPEAHATLGAVSTNSQVVVYKRISRTRRVSRRTITELRSR